MKVPHTAPGVVCALQSACGSHGVHCKVHCLEWATLPCSKVCLLWGAALQLS